MMYQDELEALMAQNIHDALKQKLNAGVFVIVEDGDLVVKIKNDFHIWEATVLGYMDMVSSNGFSNRKVVNKVLREYKSEVLSWYFK